MTTTEPLNQREREVLALVAEGYETHGIAAKLFISSNTVKTWKTRLYEKLNARNGAHAVHLAYQRGDLIRHNDDEAVKEAIALALHAREMGYRIALAPLAGGTP